MVLYHTIRAFLTAAFIFPFWLCYAFFSILSDIFSFAADIDFGYFNPIKTYKIVYKNKDSDEFHKWTGKRIK